MLDATYPPPVAALLTVGNSLEAKPEPPTGPMQTFEEMRAEMEACQNSKTEPPPFRSVAWPDYRQFGIGTEYVPDLLAMVVDETLNEADPESPESWAPVHAWRVLGQLHAVEAIDPLLALLDEWEDGDYFQEEMPDVFGLIGPAALPALIAFLVDSSHSSYVRGTAARGIAAIGRMHPETRREAVATITDRLAAYSENDEDLNTYLLSPLLDLEAVESLPVIKAVYDADAVDVSFLGDWEDVEISFGVRTQRDTPRPRYNPLGLDFDFDQLLQTLEPSLDADIAEDEGIRRHRNADKKAKNRKKMADKSRRQNRKRK